MYRCLLFAGALLLSVLAILTEAENDRTYHTTGLNRHGKIFPTGAPHDSTVEVARVGNSVASKKATGKDSRVHPNRSLRRMKSSTDLYLQQQTNLGMGSYLLKVYDPSNNGAWDKSAGSSEVVVAIAGTGLDREHEDLLPNLFYNTIKSKSTGAKAGDCDYDGVDSDGNGFIDDCSGWNFVDNSNDPYDDDGASTAEAGIIAAAGNNGRGIAGISWNARLMALKVCKSVSNGGTPETFSLKCSNADLARAIDYAISFGVRVFHFGFGILATAPSVVVQAAVTRASKAYGEKGMLIVTNAGDDGLDVNPVYNTTTETNTILMQYPASYVGSHIISVASHTTAGVLSSFSNYGSSIISTSAPGEGIVTTLPSDGNAGNYDAVTGTQFAAAQVTGAVALLLARQPLSDTAEIVHLMKHTGQPLVVTSTNKLAWKKAINVFSLLDNSFDQSAVLTTSAGVKCAAVDSTCKPTWTNEENGCGKTGGLTCPKTNDAVVGGTGEVQTLCVKKLVGDDVSGCFCPPDFQKNGDGNCVKIDQTAVRGKNYWCQSNFAQPPGYLNTAVPESTLANLDVTPADCANSEHFVKCTGSPRGYSCACPTGFTPSSTAAYYASSSCMDADECALGIHGCHTSATCVNTIGSFLCNCPVGYFTTSQTNTACSGVSSDVDCWSDVGPAKTCQDINECTDGAHKCVATTSTCVNQPGGYYCECKTGFASSSASKDGAAQCKDVNECIAEPNKCGTWTVPTHLNDRKVCINTFGSYTCSCPTGMYNNKKKCLTAYTTLALCNSVTNSCASANYGAATCARVAVIGGGARFACKCNTGTIEDANGKCV